MASHAHNKFSLSNYTSPISILLSLISAIVYITIFAGSLDKRIAVIEGRQSELDDKMTILRSDIGTVNSIQSQEQIQFRMEVNSQLGQMGQRIEKIYSILLDAKKREMI